MKNLVVVFILWINIYCMSQAIQNPYAITIKQEATTMAKLLINSDYNTFAEYVFPSIIKKIRGDRNLTIMMKENMKSIQIKSITFDEPSPVINYKGELQCTIQENMEIVVEKKKIMMKSTLIAISQDNGKKWYFVDANQDLKTLQIALPNLSDSLIIPRAKRPIIIE